ncbi:transcriptional regulator with PAS, ATPase and Fis domain [Bacillus pakistanensis]|uniref:HTH-type transcriptional regulatory protein TyrR n=1 Tax=Rossellomorea pakistanensis TaxID=992288 RepID=A0ABS2N751_9BACI|nr:sigma 54-interacting transcriptional regulator [Bacillus pakistanensis]MBM7583673.1 transcriptional regulator with PAS, ATPase and Fis domain [Bacillus pakistanensis]
MNNKKIWNEHEAILHSLQDDILVTNTDGIILKVSEATGAHYNVKSEDMIGRSVYDLEKEGVFTPILTPLVMKEKKKITLVQTSNEGKKLLVTGIPVFDQNNTLVRIVSYSHDVTELLNMKKYLTDMEDEMERVKGELEILRNRHHYKDGIIAKSEEMKKVLHLALQVAEVDVNVLLLGESGVGKSHIAKFIHNKSPRKAGPFIEVNCGAIPESLFEAEFFGYEAGSFTGAKSQGKPGLAELAEGGTLFLDEIGELSLVNQVKILKFIQEKQFYRVGGTKPRFVDFRILAATNKNLEKAVEEKTFREDLFFRLNVVPITIPPLRKRTEDIYPLIEHFINYFSEKYKRKRSLDEGVLHQLLLQDWNGNVRELMNLVERIVVISPKHLIEMDHLPDRYLKSSSNYTDIDDNGQSLTEVLNNVEKQILSKVRKRYKTTVRMAKALGISQPSVVRKMKKHRIK